MRNKKYKICVEEEFFFWQSYWWVLEILDVAPVGEVSIGRRYQSHAGKRYQLL